MIQWLSQSEANERLKPSDWKKITLTFAFVFFPLAFYLPLKAGWILLLFCGVKALPKYKIHQITAILVVVLGTLVLFRTLPWLGITQSALFLLSYLSIAKLLEGQKKRDVEVLFLAELLLLLVAFMYTSSPIILLYAIIALLLMLNGLMILNQTAIPKPFQFSLRLFGMAIPFSIVLFFFFPRIDPLWHMPNTSRQNVTGLSDEMSMGDVASLAQSSEVVFRVKFPNGNIPKPQDLYWRGPVLWHYDGKNWTQRQQDFRPAPVLEALPKHKIQYEWIPVKKDIQWLTGLDIVLNEQKNLMQGYAYQVRYPMDKKNQPKTFHLTSLLHSPAHIFSEQDKNDALQLPNYLILNQTKALAEHLKNENGGTDLGFVQGFMKHIQNGEYYYSLEPPPNMGDVEQFLFSPTGKIGFCEHYANAFTLSARSIGIPARVVLGYQGGEYNSITGDWLVREEHAHAWSELYIDGRWQRFDPTAAVAPERILQARISADSLTGEDGRSLVSRWAESASVILTVREMWDAVGLFWQDWVIGLNRDQQLGFLSALGLSAWGEYALLLLLFAVLGGLFAIYYAYLGRKIPEGDALAQAMKRFLIRLEEHGYIKLSREPVAVFLRRIAPKLPEKSAQTVIQIAQDYENSRYYERANHQELIKLLKQYRVFD